MNDDNYDIRRELLPLKTICAVKVAVQIVVVNINELDVVEMRQCLETLEIPDSLKEMVKNMIVPIEYEYYKWIEKYGRLLDPCWTTYGTIDIAKSALCILRNKKGDVGTRYKLACHCCLVKQMCEIFTEFQKFDPDFNRKCHLRSNLMEFWAVALKEGKDELKYGARLTQHAYADGLVLACAERNDIAIKFFMSKASFSDVKETFNLGCVRVVTPATFVSVYKYLDLKDKYLMARHTCEFLVSLLKWPNQKFFMKGFDSNFHYLLDEDYWDVVKYLIHKIGQSYKDFDYRELFVRTWLMRSTFIRYRDFDRFQSQVVNVILCNDAQLTKFLMKDLSEEERNVLRRKFNNESNKRKIEFELHSFSKHCGFSTDENAKGIQEFQTFRDNLMTNTTE